LGDQVASRRMREASCECEGELCGASSAGCRERTFGSLSRFLASRNQSLWECCTSWENDYPHSGGGKFGFLSLRRVVIVSSGSRALCWFQV